MKHSEHFGSQSLWKLMFESMSLEIHDSEVAFHTMNLCIRGFLKPHTSKINWNPTLCSSRGASSTKAAAS